LAIQTRRVVQPAAKVDDCFLCTQASSQQFEQAETGPVSTNRAVAKSSSTHGRLRLLNLGNAVRRQPVDKRLDIHRVFCAEPVNLALTEFLSNNRPAQIQCFSGHL